MDDGTAGSARRFDFDWQPRYRAAALAFGVTPRRAWVAVDDDELRIRFGWWSLSSPLSNVSSVHVTGPYAFVKTAGPAHLSMSDRGISFATTNRAGLCVQFHDPVPGIGPTDRIVHPGATVTVADLDGLAALLGFGAGRP